MSSGSTLFQRITLPAGKRILLLILSILAGAAAGAFYATTLRTDRVETRIFLGSYPIFDEKKLGQAARPIEALVRSRIVPEALAAAGLPVSEQTVQTSVADATIILVSSALPNNYDMFRTLHQRIADKIVTKAALDESIQKQAVDAKITALEQSIAAREAAVDKIEALRGQIAEVSAKIEASGSAAANGAARQCVVIEVGSQDGEKPQLICDTSTLAAGQRIDAAKTALNVTVEDRDNRLKIEELKADLTYDRLLVSNLFVEPAVVDVGTITSISGKVAGIFAALTGGLLGLIAGLAAMAGWNVIREMSFGVANI